MNINKLRGKIVEEGLNIEKVSKMVGMDRTTFYRKLNQNGETFTVREVNQLRKILKLTKDEAVAIFFGNNVA